MHAGQNVKMMPGAVAACALPMALGLLFTGLILVGGNSNERFMTLPIALCFLFGTPLSAWLACRRLRNIKDPKRLSKWGVNFWAGLKWATLIHLSSALLYTLGFFVVTSLDNDVMATAHENVIFSILFMSGFINAILWCVLTLPFSLLCATIFWRVTKFPEDVSVF
jgi:hypothetical protein